MLDPYAESFSSTGEPPTVPPESSRNNLYSTQSICNDNRAQSSREEMSVSFLSSTTRSRTSSGPDSGYEASPSSFHNETFFGGQPRAAANQIDLLQSCNFNPDEEFELVECHSAVVSYSESESDLEDYDTCQECCSSSLTCSCSRTDSSYATAISNCDNSRCNSSDLTFNRPSSQPIQVPNQQISATVRSRLIYSFGSLLDMYPEVRSLPIHVSQMNTLGLIPEYHPLSWPSITYSPSRNQRRTTALPSPRDNHISMSRDDIPNRLRRCNQPPRSRRQIIDSEASSFCSSDEEGSEDVFSTSAEEPLTFPMTTADGAPLPDVILEAEGDGGRAPVPPQSHEQVIRNVGRRLRTMSATFERDRMMRIEVVLLSRNRSYSDCCDSHPNGVS